MQVYMLCDTVCLELSVHCTCTSIVDLSLCVYKHVHVYNYCPCVYMYMKQYYKGDANHRGGEPHSQY